MLSGIAHQPNLRRSAKPYCGRGTGAETMIFRDQVRQDPDYAPTALLSCPRDACALGLGAVWIKNEGARLACRNLGSFKPLGVMGAMACLHAGGGGPPDRLVCASDGNFGRAVAWGGARMGIPATIFVPQAVSPERVAAITAFGAVVQRVAGGYDAAMAAAFAAAQAPGVLELTDTGHGAATDIPFAIQAAYGVLVSEILEAMPRHGPLPTHVFVPAGVGGLAAGLVAALDDHLGAQAPDVISVQPHLAGSLLKSLKAGHVHTMPEINGMAKSPPTVMMGLACETPSATAWPVLSARLAHALAIADSVTVAGMRRLADPLDGAAIVAGESGAAAYGALLKVCADPLLRGALGLGPEARVCVLVTETATDKAIYERLVRGAAVSQDFPVGSPHGFP